MFLLFTWENPLGFHRRKITHKQCSSVRVMNKVGQERCNKKDEREGSICNIIVSQKSCRFIDDTIHDTNTARLISKKQKA